MFVKKITSFEKIILMVGIIKSSESRNSCLFPEENKTIEVERYEWQNIRYKVDAFTKRSRKEVWELVHYPSIAWAITVHISQGLTFDKAAIDVSQKVLCPDKHMLFISFTILRRPYFAFSVAV
jgi:ATP-dependent exoDNAse (exonuclease V) alpha subunit